MGSQRRKIKPGTKRSREIGSLPTRRQGPSPRQAHVAHTPSLGKHPFCVCQRAKAACTPPNLKVPSQGPAQEKSSSAGPRAATALLSGPSPAGSWRRWAAPRGASPSIARRDLRFSPLALSRRCHWGGRSSLPRRVLIIPPSCGPSTSCAEPRPIASSLSPIFTGSWNLANCWLARTIRVFKLPGK